MTWFKLDDGWLMHPKIQAAGLHGRALWLAGGLYSAAQLTDGRIPKGMVNVLVIQAGVRKTDVKKLVELGLWIDDGDDYLMPGFLDYQPSRADIIERRGKWARKKSLHDDRDLIAAIRERDGDHCRYCGRTVNWKDRKGSLGGTYDHVDPEGPNTLGNVVVACRGCNSGKRRRTPEEAGMHLRDLTGSTAKPAANDLPRSSTRPVPSRPMAIGGTDIQSSLPVAGDEGHQALAPSCDRVLEAIADWKAEHNRAPIANIAAWRASVIVDAASEHHAEITRLVTEYPSAPATLIAGKILGQPARNLNLYRRQETA